MKNPYSAVFQGLLDQRAGTNVAPLRADERLDGRLALVTGANRGLGLAVSAALAKRGAEVLMACRSGIPEAGEEVARRSGSKKVSMLPLDLADLAKVGDFCEALAREGRQVDVLVLNAGVVPREARPTAQGLELMFGVNFLANVALVEELLARGLLRFDGERRPRIVFVSSDSHRGAGPVDFEAFGKWQDYGAMAGVRVYGYTKLLLSIYAAELARRLGDRASVHHCCPGAVNSDIAREAPAYMKPLLSVVMSIFFRAPEDAARTVEYLACAEALEDSSGHYLHIRVDKEPDALCGDAALGSRLVEESRALLARLQNTGTVAVS